MDKIIFKLKACLYNETHQFRIWQWIKVICQPSIRLKLRVFKISLVWNDAWWINLQYFVNRSSSCVSFGLAIECPYIYIYIYIYMSIIYIYIWSIFKHCTAYKVWINAILFYNRNVKLHIAASTNHPPIIYKWQYTIGILITHSLGFLELRFCNLLKSTSCKNWFVHVLSNTNKHLTLMTTIEKPI